MRLASAVLLLAASCFGGDVTGKWDVIAQSGGGPEMKMEMTLAGTPAALSGTLANPAGSRAAARRETRRQ